MLRESVEKGVIKMKFYLDEVDVYFDNFLRSHFEGFDPYSSVISKGQKGGAKVNYSVKTIEDVEKLLWWLDQNLNIKHFEFEKDGGIIKVIVSVAEEPTRVSFLLLQNYRWSWLHYMFRPIDLLMKEKLNFSVYN